MTTDSVRARPGLTEYRLHTPEVCGQRVSFSWDFDGPQPLYEHCGFHLEFPANVPLDRVEPRFWWTIFIMCLHSHWALLRPCRVQIPVALGARELSLWQRLVRSYSETLAACYPLTAAVTELELISGNADAGPPCPSAARLPATALQAATAFSGGKDSMAQALLLMEMGFEPLLVTTTSLTQRLSDQSHPRRSAVLAAFQAHTGARWLEVHSNLRGNWINHAARELGNGIAVNELTDTLVYTAATAAAAYALGVPHVLLASENELALGCSEQGSYIQHPHCMYSALTQAGLGAVLAPFGLSHGSLTTALRSSQVQELVTRRYRPAAAFQFSCWRAQPGEQACSICGDCKRLAWVSLAAGGRPLDMGVNMVTLLNNHGWTLTRKQAEGRVVRRAERNASASFKAQIMFSILAVSPGQMLGYLLRMHARTFIDGSAWSAWRHFLRLRREAQASTPELSPVQGARLAYLELLPEVLAERLRPILLEQFGEDPPASYRAYFEELQVQLQQLGAAASPTPP